MTWWARFVWKLRARRHVRIQLMNNAGAIDGVLFGVDDYHYRLRNAIFFAQVQDSLGTEMLGEAWIPRERVFLLNVKIP
jgi:predicted membrane protein